MDDFYIVLPSNTPVPGNTASHFTVRLPHTLELDSSWTVALSSFIYPHSFSTIGIDGEDEFVEVFAENPYEGGDQYLKVKIQIPSLQFNSVEQMRKTLNELIKKGYDQEVGRLRPKRSDRQLTREQPRHEKPLQREPSRKEKQLQREPKPKQLQREETKPKQLQREDDQNLKTIQDVLQAGLLAEGMSGLSSADRIRLNTAKNVTERSWKETVELAKKASDYAAWANSKRQRVEKIRQKAPNAPGVREWHTKFLTAVSRIQFLSEKISEESRKAAKATRDIAEYVKEENLAAAKATADIAKKALQEVKKYSAEIGPLYGRTAPESNLGANEMGNRVETAVHDFLDPPEILPRPVEDPAYPPGHPKLKEQEKPLPRERTKEQKTLQREEPTEEPTEREKSKEKPLQREKEEISREKPLPREQVEPTKPLPQEQPKKQEKTVSKVKTIEKSSEFPEFVDDHDYDQFDEIPPESTEPRPVVETSYEDPNAFYSEDDLQALPIPQALTSDEGEEKKLIDFEGLVAEFLWNDTKQRFTVIMGARIHWIKLSKQIAYVLGYDQTRIGAWNGSSYAPDLSGGVKQMYVYAPRLVEDTIIGDRMAPLLRVVNIDSKAMDVREVIYTNEFFHPLQTKRISEISIEIQTPFGRYLKFHWGTCVVTLHFKRKLF